MTENTVQVRVRVSRELLDKIDRHRGLIPRERWMRAVLEGAVGDGVVEATLSEVKETSAPEQAGPVPVLSAYVEGVRPAASPLPHHAEIDGRQSATTVEGGSVNRTESDGQKPARDDDGPVASRTHGDHLSRQARLNAAKVQRGKPKKRKE